MPPTQERLLRCVTEAAGARKGVLELQADVISAIGQACSQAHSGQIPTLLSADSLRVLPAVLLRTVLLAVPLTEAGAQVAVNELVALATREFDATGPHGRPTAALDARRTDPDWLEAVARGIVRCLKLLPKRAVEHVWQTLRERNLPPYSCGPFVAPAKAPPRVHAVVMDARWRFGARAELDDWARATSHYGIGYSPLVVEFFPALQAALKGGSLDVAFFAPPCEPHEFHAWSAWMAPLMADPLFYENVDVFGPYVWGMLHVAASPEHLEPIFIGQVASALPDAFLCRSREDVQRFVTVLFASLKAVSMREDPHPGRVWVDQANVCWALKRLMDQGGAKLEAPHSLGDFLRCAIANASGCCGEYFDLVGVAVFSVIDGPLKKGKNMTADRRAVAAFLDSLLTQNDTVMTADCRHSMLSGLLDCTDDNEAKAAKRLNVMAMSRTTASRCPEWESVVHRVYEHVVGWADEQGNMAAFRGGLGSVSFDSVSHWARNSPFTPVTRDLFAACVPYGWFKMDWEAESVAVVTASLLAAAQVRQAFTMEYHSCKKPGAPFTVLPTASLAALDAGLLFSRCGVAEVSRIMDLLVEGLAPGRGPQAMVCSMRGLDDLMTRVRHLVGAKKFQTKLPLLVSRIGDACVTFRTSPHGPRLHAEAARALRHVVAADGAVSLISPIMMRSILNTLVTIVTSPTIAQAYTVEAAAAGGESRLLTFDAAQSCLFALLRHRSRAIYNSLPVYTSLVTELARVAIVELRTQAALRRVTEVFVEMAKHPDQMRHYITPVLAATLKWLTEEAALPSVERFEIDQGVFAFFGAANLNARTHALLVFNDQQRQAIKSLLDRKKDFQ